MEGLKQKTYVTLQSALTEIFQSSNSLIADSQVRNLNTGLCLVQCGFIEHPLVRSMALGKKRYVAYWTNNPDMEQLLLLWLQSEVLYSMKDRRDRDSQERIKLILSDANEYHAKLHYYINNSLQAGQGLPINWYTYIMLGHLLRNLAMLAPDSFTIQKNLKDATHLITLFADAQLENNNTLFLDFCLSFYTGMSELLTKEQIEVRNKVATVVNGILSGSLFWQDENHSNIAHTLMDLHLAGDLATTYWERGIDELCKRIEQVISADEINLQHLIRLTRALGELGKEFDGLSQELYRDLTLSYAGDILEEIKWQVIDRRGYSHEAITSAVSSVQSSGNDFNRFDEGFLKRLFLRPFDNPNFRADPNLGYVDLVKPPAQTLENGGDCDCVAAMYASMLCASGHIAVDILHLSQKDSISNEELLHAVTCIRTSMENPPEFYCFDAQLKDTNEGVIPRLYYLDDKHVSIFVGDTLHSTWKVNGKKTLHPQDVGVWHYDSHSPTNGLLAHPREVHLPTEVVTWTLLYLDDGSDGTANFIREFMERNVEQRNLAFFDIIVQPGDLAFDGYVRHFELNKKTLNDLPALVVSYRYETYPADDSEIKIVIPNKVLKGMRAHGLNDILLRLQLLNKEQMEKQLRNIKGEIRKTNIANLLNKLYSEIKDIGTSILSISYPPKQ